jgi:hypothetical protein
VREDPGLSLALALRCDDWEEEATMLYDAVYALGYLFQRFLQDNPDLLEELSPYHFFDDEKAASTGYPVVERRLIAWLDLQPETTTPVQRAILLHMVQEYAQFEDAREELQALVTS